MEYGDCVVLIYYFSQHFDEIISFVVDSRSVFICDRVRGAGSVFICDSVR